MNYLDLIDFVCFNNHEERKKIELNLRFIKSLTKLLCTFFLKKITTTIYCFFKDIYLKAIV